MLSEKWGYNGNICAQARCVHSRQSLGERVQSYLYHLKVCSERYSTPPGKQQHVSHHSQTLYQEEDT